MPPLLTMQLRCNSKVEVRWFYQIVNKKYHLPPNLKKSIHITLLNNILPQHVNFRTSTCTRRKTVWRPPAHHCVHIFYFLYNVVRFPSSYYIISIVFASAPISIRVFFFASAHKSKSSTFSLAQFLINAYILLEYKHAGIINPNKPK